VHHLGEVALFAPPPPPIVERLRRTILVGGVTPAQTIAIDEDNSTQCTTVVDPRLAIAPGKEGFKTRQLRLGQPEETAHSSVTLRSLNHAVAAGSKGPAPNLQSKD
jgi:hypothetical protein